jgi:hypothetical protein
MVEFEITKNENGKGFLVKNAGALPVGKPHKSSKGNYVYNGGKWIRTKTNGSKSEHLYRVNVTITDCGKAKD